MTNSNTNSVDSLNEILDKIFGVPLKELLNGGITREEAKQALKKLLIAERVDENSRAEIWQDRGLVFKSEDGYGNTEWVSQADRQNTLNNTLSSKPNKLNTTEE